MRRAALVYCSKALRSSRDKICVRMPLRRSVKPVESERRADPAAVRAAAVVLLARRDFGAAELRRKLTARGFEALAVEGVIAELTHRGTLNETRYAQNYVSWHVARGQGPLRIAADLSRSGLAPELIAGALAVQEDWATLAAKVRSAKFGPAAPANWRERARQARFLQYRGFSADHIRAAIGADSDWTEGP